jgi:hypothetical protein
MHQLGDYGSALSSLAFHRWISMANKDLLIQVKILYYPLVDVREKVTPRRVGLFVVVLGS